jgi:hypothetical protein
MRRGRVWERRRGLYRDGDLRALLWLSLAGIAVGALANARRPVGGDPNRHSRLAQRNGKPPRRYYSGSVPSRAVAIADLRARTHQLLPRARELIGDRMQLYVAGGIRRGTDLLKAVALGADAVLAGRAPLYGLCAYGGRGAVRALEILEREAGEALGLLGANSPQALGREFLVPAAHPSGASR